METAELERTRLRWQDLQDRLRKVEVTCRQARGVEWKSRSATQFQKQIDLRADEIAAAAALIDEVLAAYSAHIRAVGAARLFDPSTVDPSSIVVI